SSRITVSTSARVSRACEVSMRNSDSGVVMRMSGGWEARRRRSAAGVSPVRTPTLISERGRPSRSAARAVPTRGEVRFRSTSTPSALSGERYSTFVAPRRRPEARARGGAVRSVRSGDGCAVRRSIAVRKAARVFPEPVGATTRVWSPRSIASHAAACAAVGASNASSNHAAVAGEKDEGRRWRVRAIAPLWTKGATPQPRGGRAVSRHDPHPAASGRIVAGWTARRLLRCGIRIHHDEGMIHMAEYTLPDLDYDYGALDPSISGKIMELHHSKHHATYVKG